MSGASCTSLCSSCIIWTISPTPHLIIKKGSGQSLVLSKTPETFRTRQAIFIWSVFIGRDVHKPETSWMRRTSFHILIGYVDKAVCSQNVWDFATTFRELWKKGPLNWIFFIQTMQFATFFKQMIHYSCYPLIWRKGQWRQNHAPFFLASVAAYETMWAL